MFSFLGGLTGWNGNWNADSRDAVLGTATVYGYETCWTPVHCWPAETNGRGTPVRHVHTNIVVLICVCLCWAWIHMSWNDFPEHNNITKTLNHFKLQGCYSWFTTDLIILWYLPYGPFCLLCFCYSCLFPFSVKLAFRISYPFPSILFIASMYYTISVYYMRACWWPRGSTPLLCNCNLTLSAPISPCRSKMLINTKKTCLYIILDTLFIHFCYI